MELWIFLLLVTLRSWSQKCTTMPSSSFIKRSDASDYYFQALALLEIFVFLLLPPPGDVVVLGFWVGVSVMQC